MPSARQALQTANHQCQVTKELSAQGLSHYPTCTKETRGRGPHTQDLWVQREQKESMVNKHSRTLPRAHPQDGNISGTLFLLAMTHMSIRGLFSLPSILVRSNLDWFLQTCGYSHPPSGKQGILFKMERKNIRGHGIFGKGSWRSPG